MKSIAIALVLTGLSGCAVVPIGPPVVVAPRASYGYGYAPPVYAPAPYYYGRRPYWRR